MNENSAPANAGATPGAQASVSPLRAWLEADGALLRLRLARPKANLIDAAMIAALDAALGEHEKDAGLLGVLLDAEGSHFSFGASVEEHLAEQCAAMLAALHGLILRMVAYPAPILVAIRGQCLGGGLEVAMAGGLLFASPEAKFGQPEIRLGVFAPAASVLLPVRIGQFAAEDLLLSGRTMEAAEARTRGLIHAVADDPSGAALEWFHAHLAGKSASSVRYALAAVRGSLTPGVRSRIAEVERLYLDELMKSHDANEGLDAFLAKRTALWKNA